MNTSRTRRLAAIMFTDIVGYTAMMQRDEKAALALLDFHRSTLERLTATYGGDLIQYYGDGSLSIYNSSVEAVQCALEMQQTYAKTTSVPLRIGIHIGDISYGDGNIYGNGVNVASRIETLGIPGAVLFSEKVWDDIRNHPEFHTQSMGAFRFKNVEKPMAVYALTNEGLQVPSAEDMQKGKLKQPPARSWQNTLLRWALPALLLVVALSYFFPRLTSFALGDDDIPNRLNSPKIVVKPLLPLHPNIDTVMLGSFLVGLNTTLANADENFKVYGLGSAEVLSVQMGIGPIQRGAEPDIIVEGSLNLHQDDFLVQTLLHYTEGNRKIPLGIDTVAKDSLFPFSASLAIRIAERIKGPLGGERKQQLMTWPSDSLRANELLAASEYYKHLTLHDTAIALVSEAIAIDPSFADAYAQRGLLYIYKTWIEGYAPSAVGNKAENDIAKALSIDEHLPMAYYARAVAHTHISWDFEQAEQNFARAQSLTPPNESVGTEYGWFCGFIKTDFDRALELLEHEFQLDPYNPACMLEYGAALLNAGKEKKGLAVFKRFREEMPNTIYAYMSHLFHFHDGNYEVAMQEAMKVEENLPPALLPYTLYMDGFISAKEEDRQRALEIIEEIGKHQLAGRPGLLDYAMPKGIIYAILGDIEDASREFRIAYNNRENFMIGLKWYGEFFAPEIQEVPEYQTCYRKWA
jgi:adenylate cyclase